MVVCNGFLKGTPRASPNVSRIFHFYFNCGHGWSLLFTRSAANPVPFRAGSFVQHLCCNYLAQKAPQAKAGRHCSKFIYHKFTDVRSRSESMCVPLMAKISLESPKCVFPSCSKGFYYYESLKHWQYCHELKHKMFSAQSSGPLCAATPQNHLL